MAILLLLVGNVLGPKESVADSQCKSSVLQPPLMVIMDSGIDTRHPALAPHNIEVMDLTGQGPEDENGHGTHVTGIAVAGLRPGSVRIVHIKVLDRDGKTDEVKLLKGLQLAGDMGAHIVNLSFGVTVSKERGEYACRKYRRIVRRFPAMLLVIAAGNEGRELGATKGMSEMLVPQECTANVEPGEFGDYVSDIEWTLSQGRVTDAEDLMVQLARSDDALRACCRAVHTKAATLSQLLVLLLAYREEPLGSEKSQLLSLARTLRYPDLDVEKVAHAVDSLIAPQDHNDRGMRYFSKRDIARAIAEFTAAISGDPACGEFFNNRMAAYLRTGDTAAAIADCEEAIHLAPELPEAHNSCGIAYGRAFSLRPSIDRFTRAIELRPDYVAALFNRGQTYLLVARPGKAAADFRRASKLQSAAHRAKAGK